MKARAQTSISFAATATPTNDNREVFLAECTKKLATYIGVAWAMSLPVNVSILVGHDVPDDQPSLTRVTEALKEAQHKAFEELHRANPNLSTSQISQALGWARTVYGTIASKKPRCFITHKRIDQIIAARDSGEIQCPEGVIKSLRAIASRRG